MSAQRSPSVRFRCACPRLLVAVLLLLLAAAAALPAYAQEPGAASTYEDGYRFDSNGWIYLHIQGDAYERGFQHGFLLAPEIQQILADTRVLTLWNTGMEWDFFVEQAEKMLVPTAEAELLEEIKGIAAGAREAGVDVTWQDMLTWNGYIELSGYWWPTVAEDTYNAMPVASDSDHCSAFIAAGDATADGGIVMAHNSWDNFESGQNMNLMLDIQPTEGHRMLMQSQPGLIASMTDFGVNDAGLMVTETTIGGFHAFDPLGKAEFFRARQAMQYAETLDDFVEIMLEENNGGYANSWLVGDSSTGEIMRFELGLKFHDVQRTQNGYYIGFNAPYDPRIRNLECSDTGFADIRRHQGARQVRLTELMRQYYGQIDVQIGQTILADHYDVYLQQADHPCARTIDGHYELDAREYVSDPSRPLPFQPRGTVDGKVMDSAMAGEMSFWARWGNSSGMPFVAADFLAEHIQWEHLAPFLKDRPSQPWTQFSAGQQPPEGGSPDVTAAVQRISFAAGSSTAALTGTLPAGGESQYVLRARAGQQLLLYLTAPDDAVLLAVDGQDGQNVKKAVQDGDRQLDWSGTLPTTQDYIISLSAVTEEAIDYTLEVEIPMASDSPATPAGAVLTEADAGQTITLAVGDTLQVTLESNPTTGYQWQRQSGDPAVIKQVGEAEYSGPDSEMLGAGGSETFTFEAAGAGETLLELVYVRSWEQDVAPDRTFEVTVVVE